jgi:hypothetical protein
VTVPLNCGSPGEPACTLAVSFDNVLAFFMLKYNGNEDTTDNNCL